MRLLVIVRAEWLIITPVDARGGCPVQRFLERLRRDAPTEHRQVVAGLRVLAEFGRITDERRVRHLGDGIHELKTRGGIRVLYFVDEGRVVVCTDAVRKPKSRQLAWLVRRSRTVRVTYVSAQRTGELRIAED
jgi:phage-related protein